MSTPGIGGAGGSFYNHLETIKEKLNPINQKMQTASEIIKNDSDSYHVQKEIKGIMASLKKESKPLDKELKKLEKEKEKEATQLKEKIEEKKKYISDFDENIPKGISQKNSKIFENIFQREKKELKGLEKELQKLEDSFAEFKNNYTSTKNKIQKFIPEKENAVVREFKNVGVVIKQTARNIFKPRQVEEERLQEMRQFEDFNYTTTIFKKLKEKCKEAGINTGELYSVNLLKPNEMEFVFNIKGVEKSVTIEADYGLNKQQLFDLQERINNEFSQS